MSQSILNGFLIFGIIQAFLFAGLLLSKQKRISADLIMISWLLLFALHSFLILLYQNVESAGIWPIVSISLSLLYGPFLFFYVDSIRLVGNKKPHLKGLHLIPFLLFFVLSFFFSSSELFLKILAFSGVSSGIAYSIFVNNLLESYHLHLNKHFSNIENINLNWLKRLVMGLLFIWVGTLILVVLDRFLKVNLPLEWFFLFIPCLISYLGYYGLRQQIVLLSSPKQTQENPKPEKPPIALKKPTNPTSYAKSGLTKEDMQLIYSKLENLMQTEKPYLTPNLSLKELSQQSHIPAHHITQSLNEYKGQNFYQYVNNYRVWAFEEKMKRGEYRQFSLLALALDCGFNSKSTFNRIFKNSTGMSPSEYQKKLS